MPIQLFWANPEKTILLEIVEGDWSLSDVYNMLDDINIMLSTVPHMVDIIADLTHAQFSTGNMLSVLGRAQRNQPGNVGRIVAVNANHYLKAIAVVAARIAPKVAENITFVESMDAAYAALAAYSAPVPVPGN